MGWLKIPSDGIGSVVVEEGTGSTNDRITKQIRKKALADAFEEDSLSDATDEGICNSPWDGDNLYFRLTKSGINEEYTMQEYAEYLSSLVELSNTRKPFRRLKQSRSLFYKIERYEPSCPSLTDGSSTLSDSSISSERISAGKIRMRHIQAQKVQKGRLNYMDYTMFLTEPIRLEIQDTPDKITEQEEGISGPGLNVVELTGADGPSEKEFGHQNLSDEQDGSDFVDPEVPTDTSSEDEDEEEKDSFETLHLAIKQAFSSSPQLADEVINYLDQLPPERQAQIYGYKNIPSCDNGDIQNSSNSIDCQDSSGPRKRKRITSPGSSIQNQVHEDNDQENQVLVDRRPSTPSSQRRFACGYNVSDRVRYGPRNTRSATQYKSCAGPGFKELNHYKRHLERVHTLHQCTRCGRVFEALGELHGHLVQDQRCSVIVFEREGMSQETWDEVKRVFKRDRKGQTGPSDEERWFLAWEALFPGKPRPPSAYYEEQQEQIPYPLLFIRIQEIFDASLSDLPQIDPTLRNEIMRRLGSAIDAANRSVPSELDSIDPNAPLASVQVPTLSNGVQGRAVGIDQTSHIEANPLNPIAFEPTPWDAIDSIGEPNHLGNGTGIEPFEDMHYLGLFDDSIVVAATEIQSASTQDQDDDNNIRATDASMDPDLVLGSCELVSHLGSQRDPAYEEYEEQCRNERLRLK
ncbi:hypothetical protein F5Y13DRAFT_197512 [Hypoxylon sp. FL1857]|nr:hypothetical protein F5Y13DRAFT_197512 [Hypoxylon sp. FL1857]